MPKFTIWDERARMRIVSTVMATPIGHQVRISGPARSLDQNAAQWPILEAFSQQLRWPVNGRMVQLDADDWKAVLTAAFETDSRIAEGLNGGHVLLGQRTSEFTRKRFSEWLEFLHHVAAERGVELDRAEA